MKSQHSFEMVTKGVRRQRRHDLFGESCALCGFNFWQVLQMHHVRPKEDGGGEYKNLIPLCPNCHAIVHEMQRKYHLYAKQPTRCIAYEKDVGWQLESIATALGFKPNLFIRLVDYDGTLRGLL